MSVKEIILKPLNSRIANEFVKSKHYSGKVVSNSQLHFGVYYKNILGGVMSFGPSTDKSKLIGLVEGTKRNEFIELNRMAFSDHLPKNAESRAIAISIKLIKKKAPHIKRIISFADGCQCGDGTIYRASGFELTQVKRNTNLRQSPDGKTRASVTFSAHKPNQMKEFNTRPKIEGYMLRYIKHLHPNLQRNYEILPYSYINEMKAGMYKGEKTCKSDK